jgi:peroxiredoxin
MIVDNGTVSQVFVEEPGQFEKSTADNILANL